MQPGSFIFEAPAKSRDQSFERVGGDLGAEAVELKVQVASLHYSRRAAH
jgi:hypothetical protein